MALAMAGQRMVRCAPARGAGKSPPPDARRQPARGVQRWRSTCSACSQSTSPRAAVARTRSRGLPCGSSRCSWSTRAAVARGHRCQPTSTDDARRTEAADGPVRPPPPPTRLRWSRPLRQSGGYGGPRPRQADTIGIEDFSKIDLRVARITAAEPVDGSDRLLKLTLDVGDGGPSGLRRHQVGLSTGRTGRAADGHGGQLAPRR